MLLSRVSNCGIREAEVNECAFSARREPLHGCISWHRRDTAVRRAREASDPVATAAARAAGLAAATAYTHALATPHQAKHALGPAVYAALARELAAVDDPSVGDEEIRWAIEHASPTVREVMRQMPSRGAGPGRLDALLYLLDAGLRR
ncbi:MAG TPA: hypothetical protein VFU22_32005 [Roseiflexaceae bacterium]|nr:hypothetical protein [Roseiflexaceae bacterium]